MVDAAKLAALRAKYEGAKETEIAPERFRKPLSLTFGSAYRRAMPYAGVSTLLDAPYRPDAPGLRGFRRARRGPCRRPDGFGRHQPAGRPLWPARGA